MSRPRDDDSASELPLKKIPGGYGLPFFGAVKDRYDYFYKQGTEEFFRDKIRRYESTVFRTNMPPGPFIAGDPRVVAVLDAESFAVVMDSSKVEKRNILDGTFMPSTAFTGGHRVCAFLDTSEPEHAKLKNFFSAAIAARKDRFIPLFRTAVSQLFSALEEQLEDNNGKLVDYNKLNDQMMFEFLFRFFSDGKDPTEYGLGEKSSKLFDKWLFFMLAPLMTLGLPKILNFFEDLVLHTFRLPWLAVKSDYKKLYDAYYSSATPILDDAVRAGLDRSEACHNLVFLAGFSSYGGFKAWFPSLIKWVAAAGEDLHRRLANEIRAAVKDHGKDHSGGGGGVTLAAVEAMPLTKSTVYEALRMEPPVPFQYGKAREDMVVRSHHARFEVKKGETIFGYQPFATRDPEVFERAEEFVPDRFVGEGGARMLRHVLWSNGRETEDPTAENKQCPGKDMVVLLSRLLLVELFLRYDTFDVDSGRLLLGSFVKFRSVTKAT